MRRVRWKWFLPLAQLLLALAAYVYEPRQFKAILVKDGVMGDNNVLEYSKQHDPAPVQRISLGINFPALALDYPLWHNSNQLWSYSDGPNAIFIEITTRGIGFFIGIAVFWYWVGKKLDECRGNRTIARSRRTRIAWLSCGLVFGILTGACAAKILVLDWYFLPERQIGFAGIAWSLALIAYFVWQLTRQFSRGEPQAGV